MKQTVTAPLEQLYVAPENARHGVPEENIGDLVANIEQYGLLQPLLAYAGAPSGAFAIVGGRRRLAALRILQAEKVKPALGRFSYKEIPLRVIAQEDAVAASLAENTQRVDLSVVDAALAWNRMLLDGRDHAAIARAFGVTERFVKGRIRLAGLYEPILDALRKGDLSLDVAQVYAGAELPRQEKVWKALGDVKDIQWHVRKALRENTLLAGDALAKFVGEDAYRAAGGIVETELFTNENNSRWLNPDLATELAQKKLAALGAELEGEGFLFVDAAIELPSGKYADGNLGKPRKPNADEKARLKFIEQRLGFIRDEQEKLHDADHPDPDAFDALDDEESDLRTEKIRIEDGLRTFDDAAKRKSGVAVTIDDDGRPSITRGVITPRSYKATPAGKSKPNGKAASTAPARPEPQAPMTNLTHEKTSRIASAIVGRTLARAPSVALVAITAALARSVFEEALDFRGLGEEVLDIGLRGAFDAGVEFLSDKQDIAAFNGWAARLGKDPAAIETRLNEWPQSDVLDLLAFCVGSIVKVIEPNASADYHDDAKRARLATLGKLAGAIPASHFVPDADYLGGFSRASLEHAAEELGIATAGAKNKAALAQMVADRAKDSTWIPPLLRTLCGFAEPAKAKQAPAGAKPKLNAAKKTAKKPAAKKTAPKKLAKPKPKKAARSKPQPEAQA